MTVTRHSQATTAGVDRDAVGLMLRDMGVAATTRAGGPRFERQVAFYVAEREREKQQPAVLPAKPARSAGSRRPPSAPATVSTPTTTRTTTPKPAPRLEIVTPRTRAHLDQTVAVRVSLTGATLAGSQSLRYVLDGAVTRLEAARLTFHGVVSGHHHLRVALISRPSVRANATFTVLAPPPATAVPPAPRHRSASR